MPEEEDQFDGFLAEVVEVPRVRTGIFGEAEHVMCKILQGKDKGRVIRRNMVGFVKVGDYVRLPDTTREAKPIRAR
ncbi:MAG: 30S ribosomal protein S28e [Candidatus Micrarchaeia archaeon]